jgi:ribosomal protein S18 acetylase RimI-like enzyme
MTKARIAIRELDFATADDMEAYLTLLDAYARDPMGSGQPLPTEVRDRLRIDLPTHPAAHGLVATRNDRAVGFATCFLGYSTFQARPLLNIHDLAVIEHARGQGIGFALLEAAGAIAERLGCCRLTLEVREENQAARRLYARAGFVSATCGRFMERPVPF